MIKSFLTSIFILILLLFSACKPEKKSLEFYYWKQDFKLNENQRQVLKEQKTERIYLKFFDIDKKSSLEQATPLAKITFSTELDSIEIVPCIYITNRTFEHGTAIPELAENIFTLLQDIYAKNKLKPYSEIQFDCDWSPKTGKAYFEFLYAFKALHNEDVILSSTLRLHQLKYPNQTGIPPVNRVSLMCYNLGNIKDPNESNSIFDSKTLESYINSSSSYPITMDIALPIFSWATVYRFEKLSLIINNLTKQDLIENELLVEEKDNFFRVTKNHYFNSSYLYTDDIIRYESVQIEDLESALPLFENLRDKDSKLILFDLSNKNLENYTYDELQNLSKHFN